MSVVYSYVTKVFKKFVFSFCLSGYFDRATEGQWTWSDCQESSPWQEALWSPGEPTGYDEDCGALEMSGLLSDYVCDQGFRYICEISPKGNIYTNNIPSFEGVVF